MAAWREDFLREQRLPRAYLDGAARFFDPLAAWLARRRVAAGRTLRVAINGSQGSGKSTLCAYLCDALRAEHGLSAVALSLDDFYLTQTERRHLAWKVHPLLATRGVPGTHDTKLMRATLDALSSAVEGTVAVPRFAKAEDDRLPGERWPRIAAPVDIVLLEGWCLGARAVDSAALEEPVNDLERLEDPDGLWRRYANRCLEKEYEPIWALLDVWIMLAAPGFEQVLAWRREQERRLAESVGGRGAGLMDEAALRRFVSHYERHTRQCLRELPERVDVLLELDSSRRVVAARGLRT